MRAVDWLRGLFGQRVFERIWDPLLRAKFGDRRDQVPAYWVWNTLNREKDGGQEVKGYLRCGYRGLAAAIADALVVRGAEVRLAEPRPRDRGGPGRRPPDDGRAAPSASTA